MSGLSPQLALVALPFETSTSFLKGTVLAPDAILNDIETMDGYDFDLGCNPFEKIQRSIVRPHKADLGDPVEQIALAERATAELLDQGVFPLSLGGEHTVSIGPVKAARARGDLGVVQIDAHSDLRDSYEGSRFSHACVMRRIFEMDCKVLGIGIRAMCADEAGFARESNIRHVNGREAAASDSWYGLVDLLPDRIYLTVDIDGFDPFEVPAVGTPEPGGPGWTEISAFLKYLFSAKQVVGADIVELMPCKGDAASIRFASRLIGLTAALRFGF